MLSITAAAALTCVLATSTLAAPSLAAVPAPADLVPTATPHPYHLSFAEVSCDAERGELQVSLAVLAIDFEETLSRRLGKRVNLDTTKGIEKIIEEYLADRFVVTLPDGSKPRPSFFGREDKTKLVWLHFTVPLTGKPAPAPKAGPTSKNGPPPKTGPTKKASKPKGSLLMGTRLRNRVLMELNPGQLNSVELREGRWRRALRFDERTQEQVLRTPAQAKGDKARTGKSRRSSGN